MSRESALRLLTMLSGEHTFVNMNSARIVVTNPQHKSTEQFRNLIGSVIKTTYHGVLVVKLNGRHYPVFLLPSEVTTNDTKNAEVK